MESLNELIAISPLDGRYANKLSDLRKLCSEYGLIKLRLEVEIHWFKTLSQCKQISELSPLSENSQQFLENLLDKFDLDSAEQVKKIEAETNHDVKAVEYFLKNQFQQHEQLKSLGEFIHFGCTSADINNLAYALMLKRLRQQYCLPVMQEITNQLQQLSHQYANIPMLSRTHGQPATPTTLGKEFANFTYRLQQQVEKFNQVNLLGKCNGAVGNFNAHLAAYPEIDWPKLSQQFVTELGLVYNPYTAQIEPHDFIAELCQSLMRFNIIMIDLCRDIWAYISLTYFSQKQKAGEVGSSTMPHKVNPIDFENAEGNLGIANTLLQHLSNKLPLSRWQRDLTDSTTLRNLGSAFCYSLLAWQSFQKGLGKLAINQQAIEADLASHWEVLAEPVQTVMRRYGIENPYEKLKELTRGKTINKETLHHFIEQLALPEDVKQSLKQLTPLNYIGVASDLATKV